MTSVTITEAVREALAAIRDELNRRAKFAETNDTDGEPLCGYEAWDEKHADFNERLAERGEHLADAVTEMIVKPNATRRLDLPSLALTFIGIVCGFVAYWLINAEGANTLVIVPSIVAVTIGATHLINRDAPRAGASADEHPTLRGKANG
ncbi:Uncharacterised protein [Mycobacteroides abscessus subsp. bolletii]|uniref:hypothetical protein n=1 Tax=Mycobacteroides abscessus TaxID=36809 RepID=UPI0009D20500|nr:hypothetical protein [Mycobacteroides abscessus]SKG76491.1 Uncharacterised protein [Mycobacteroides abscessus subsp. bolletii]SKH08423.1 Uncharacterised protein [Mycobacteroides abscessus subsp. bolletii]